MVFLLLDTGIGNCAVLTWKDWWDIFSFGDQFGGSWRQNIASGLFKFLLWKEWVVTGSSILHWVTISAEKILLWSNNFCSQWPWIHLHGGLCLCSHLQQQWLRTKSSLYRNYLQRKLESPQCLCHPSLQMVPPNPFWRQLCKPEESSVGFDLSISNYGGDFVSGCWKGTCLLLSLTCLSWHLAPVTGALPWLLKKQEATVSPKLPIQVFLSKFSSPNPSAFPKTAGPAGSSITLHADRETLRALHHCRAGLTS